MEKRRHRLRESVFLKVVAAAAAIVTFFVGFFSAILAIACIQNDVYFDGGETFLKNATEIVNLEATQKFVSYLSNSSPRMLDGKVVDNEGYDENFDGYFFELCDVDTGDVIWSNLPDDYEESCTLVVDDSRWAMRVLTDYYIRDTDTQGDVFNALSNLVSKNEVLGFQGDLKAVYSFTFNDVGADYDNSLAESSDSPSLKPPVWIASEDTPYVTTFVGGEHVGPFEVTLLSISKDGDVTITPEGGRFFNRLIYLDSLDGITLTTDSSGEEYLISLSELKKIKDLFISFGTTDEIMALSGVSDSGMIEGGELTCTLDGYSRAASTIDFSAKTYIRNEGAPSYGDGHIANYPSSISFVVKKISQFAYYYPVIAVCCVIVWLLSTIYLCCACGWRETSNGAPSPIWFDKLPYLIFAVLLIVGIVFSIQSYFELRYHLTVVFVNYRIATLAVWALVPLLTGILLTLTLMTTSVRLKCGVFWKYTAVGYIFRITAKIWHAIKKAVKGFFAAVSVNWLIMVCGIAYLLYNIFWLLIFDDFLTPAMILLGNIAMIIILMIWAGGFTKLKNFIHKLAQGDFGGKLNRGMMIGDLSKCAGDLENIGDGVKKAVDQQMRSERLKTELITNVSHDLKTPLTSIVNYIDILSKDNIEDETAREHIEVIKRQADRMKKLIEDLVDVSKASSGSVAVSLTRTDVCLLLTQTAAEYSERFERAGLEAVIRLPEKPLIAELDGRLTWRVFDNLCNNICKYALTRTRVYISAEQKGPWIHISFKNISREVLEISGEDLTERFVRGDASRNTEGSGLGLSIAKSLCDLQKVGFGITVDGDLFKAELTVAAMNDSEFFVDDDSRDFAPAAENMQESEPETYSQPEPQPEPQPANMPEPQPPEESASAAEETKDKEDEQKCQENEERR